MSSSSLACHRASSRARHCGPSKTGVVTSVLRSSVGIVLLRDRVLPSVHTPAVPPPCSRHGDGVKFAGRAARDHPRDLLGYGWPRPTTATRRVAIALNPVIVAVVPG